MKKKREGASCIFELVYFARPDSIVFGQSVYGVRKEAGRRLAEQDEKEGFLKDVDLVIPVPDSGVPSALGYSVQSGKPFELGIIRNHYIGRTFIQPHQAIRDFGVKIKLNPQTSVLSGKRVVVIDDSLVRGTTSKKILQLVRAAGAKEVHLRIAAPPTIGPCYYGVDTPEKSQTTNLNTPTSHSDRASLGPFCFPLATSLRVHSPVSNCGAVRRGRRHVASRATGFGRTGAA